MAAQIFENFVFLLKRFKVKFPTTSITLKPTM